MRTLTHDPHAGPRHPRWRERTSRQERRRGMRLLLISVAVAALMFGAWWLVASTNREGHHDAQLLPLVTLFTLVPAVFHLLLARYLRTRGR